MNDVPGEPTSITADGTASPLDVLALKRIQEYGAGELTRIQSRAAKWLPGLVAVTGVLTTAIVVKGVDSFTKLADSWKQFGGVPPANLIIGSMSLGGLAIALGVIWAYSAAYGDPMAKDSIADRASQQKVDGAWAAWTKAIDEATASARRSLRAATIATVVGTLLLAAAVGFTWAAPSKDASGPTICFSSGGQVVEVAGDVPEVKSGRLILVPCK